MQYRPLGDTGVKVSQLCYGTMSFGGDADEAESARLFARCRDAGINFFDTAVTYTEGRSEEILGRLIADCRDELVISTKGFGRIGPDVNARGATRRYLMRAVERSLKRLGTDRIDVYFLHHFDAETPIEESLRALDDLVHQGKILYPACSNFTAWQTMKGLGISAREGLNRFRVLQPMYNLVKRTAEVEILPLALDQKLAVTPYSPMGGGLLSGKYSRSQRPATGRFAQSAMYTRRYSDAWMFETAERFSAVAAELGHHPATLAVAWVGNHPAVTAPIIGARSVEQLEPSLKAAGIQMKPDLWQRIADLAPEPPHPTDRSEERGA